MMTTKIGLTMKTLPVAVILIFLASSLAACGGGGGGDGSAGPTIEPNSVLLSDMHINFQDQTFRVTDLYCLPDLSRCQATFQGQIIEFTPDEDSDAEGEIYQTLGEWGHMRTAALYAQLQGFQARYAVAGGVTYPNSIPRGTATWSGDMVGLDSNNRVIRGGAFVQLTDFGDPRVGGNGGAKLVHGSGGIVSLRAEQNSAT